MTSYKDDLEIDKLDLDGEWTRQSLLFMKWAEETTKAQKKKDLLYQKRDLVKAEIDKEKRNNFIQKGEKFTEAIIDAEIKRDDRYQKSQLEYISAVEEASIFESAKWAMEHKKKALEMLTSLWIAGYYSEPNIPKEAKEQSFERTSKEFKKFRRREK